MSASQHPTPPARANIIMAPHPFPPDPTRLRSVFLAGTIDRSPPTWQATLSAALAHHPLTILNPHRSDWDSSWVEDASFAPFAEQVAWELDMQARADVIVVYFGPGTVAPISLLELGLWAGSGKCVVCCPRGFGKGGNVRIVCARWGVEIVEELGEVVGKVEGMLGLGEGGKVGGDEVGK